MAIKRIVLGLALCIVASMPTGVFAEEVSNDAVYADESAYFLGSVTMIFSETLNAEYGMEEMVQDVNVRMMTGPDNGTDQRITYVTSASLFAAHQLDVGDTVIVTQDPGAGSGEYIVLDTFRIPGVLIVFAIFLLLAIVFARLRGVTSMFGLAASLAILTFGIVPAIMAGHDPLLVCLIGSGAIAIVSILLAHGVNRRSVVALIATILTLVLCVLFSLLAVMLAQLAGSGTEEALYLQIGSLPSLNLRGLLLGGMIIGTLGVLDDVTTAQVAAVEELRLANTSFGAAELYRRGIRVGREHIAALVNTLALAYAGASFPLFLLFSVQGGPPLWVVLNSEHVMEEVIRAIVGGASLVIAVPIATALAAYYFSRPKNTHYAR